MQTNDTRQKLNSARRIDMLHCEHGKDQNPIIDTYVETFKYVCWHIQ